MAVYNVRHKCNICHNGIIVINNSDKFKYYKCDKCDLIYVLDRKTDKYVRAYKPRKTIKL